MWTACHLRKCKVVSRGILAQRIAAQGEMWHRKFCWQISSLTTLWVFYKRGQGKKCSSFSLESLTSPKLSIGFQLNLTRWPGSHNITPFTCQGLKCLISINGSQTWKLGYPSVCLLLPLWFHIQFESKTCEQCLGSICFAQHLLLGWRGEWLN